MEHCFTCSRQKLSLHHTATKLAAPFIWMCTPDLTGGVKLAHRMTLKFSVHLPDLLCGDSTLFVPFKSSLQPFLFIKKNQYVDALYVDAWHPCFAVVCRVTAVAGRNGFTLWESH